MGTPQILIIVLYSIGLLLVANNHGKEKTGKYSIWSRLTSTAITFALLIWGGFFA